MVVFPAFALPMMSTLNLTSGTRGRSCCVAIVPKGCSKKDSKVMITRWIPLGLYVIIAAQLEDLRLFVPQSLRPRRLPFSHVSAVILSFPRVLTFVDLLVSEHWTSRPVTTAVFGSNGFPHFQDISNHASHRWKHDRNTTCPCKASNYASSRQMKSSG